MLPEPFFYNFCWICLFLLRRIHFLLQKLFKSFQFNISYYYKLHYTAFLSSFLVSSTVLSPLLIWFVKKELTKIENFTLLAWRETNSTIYFNLLNWTNIYDHFFFLLFSVCVCVCVWNKRLNRGTTIK